MGQKRIKTVDLSKPKQDTAKAPKKQKREEKGRRVVKTGKEHGRLTDMGQVMLEEAERRAAEEKKPSPSSKPPKLSKPSKSFRVRSHRFAALRKMIKRDKLYSPKEAIKLLKQMANISFDETVELHLVSRDLGVLGKIKLPSSVSPKTDKEAPLQIKTEKKFPLAHLKLGKTSWPEKKLLENLQAILASLQLPRLKKAVLTSTMSPGIKLRLRSEKQSP